MQVRPCSLMILVMLLAVAGCEWPAPPLPPRAAVYSRLLDRNGNVTLYVSNQSFALSPVDIEVLIDDETVVYDHFNVADQHSWKVYIVALEPGVHKVRARSVHGEAIFSTDFVVDDKHWAIVDYYYDPDPKYEPEPTPRRFGWVIRDKPIYFQ